MYNVSVHQIITAEQAKAMLDDALAILGEAELDDELRAPAFAQVLQWLGQRHVVVEQAAAPMMAIPRNARH